MMVMDWKKNYRSFFRTLLACTSPLIRRFLEPFPGFGHVLGQAETGLIHHAQVILFRGIAFHSRPATRAGLLLASAAVSPRTRAASGHAAPNLEAEGA